VTKRLIGLPWVKLVCEICSLKIRRGGVWHSCCWCTENQSALTNSALTARVGGLPVATILFNAYRNTVRRPLNLLVVKRALTKTGVVGGE